jgi:hypothetical protein
MPQFGADTGFSVRKTLKNFRKESFKILHYLYGTVSV